MHGAAVVRTVCGLTAPASICAVALQSADFGAPVSGHLTVRSAQTGGLGRGRGTNLPRPVVGCSLLPIRAPHPGRGRNPARLVSQPSRRIEGAKRFVFTQIPRTSTGKIKKFALQNMMRIGAEGVGRPFCHPIGPMRRNSLLLIRPTAAPLPSTPAAQAP